MEFFDFPLSIREFPSCFQIAIIGRSEIALMWLHWLPLQNERKMQTEMNAKCKRKWWFRWLLLRLSNKGRTNVSSAWMAVLKHPAIGAKSRFTKIYENLANLRKWDLGKTKLFPKNVRVMRVWVRFSFSRVPSHLGATAGPFGLGFKTSATLHRQQNATQNASAKQSQTSAVLETIIPPSSHYSPSLLCNSPPQAPTN